MRKIRTRAFSILLTCAMLLSLLPVTALATSTTDCPSDETCSHEAAIGSTHYDTIGEAIDAANRTGDCTVKLLKNATLKRDYTRQKAILKDMILDLGGYTLTYAGEYGFVVNYNVEFKIQNGTYKNTAAKGAGIQAFKETEKGPGCTIIIAEDATVNAEDGIVTVGYTDLKVYGTIISKNIAVFGMGPKNNVTLDRAKIQAGTYGVYQQGKDGGSIYTIKNSTITTPSDTDSCAVFISNNKASAGAQDQGRQTLIVENSVISGQDGIEVQYTDVTISGDGTQVTAAEDGHALGVTYKAGEEAEGTVHVTGGTFTGTVGAMEDKGALNITITGGKFTDDVNSYVAPGMMWDSKTGQIMINTKTAVAQIGNMGYDTLEAAISDAKAGDTITLLQSIILSSAVTLNQNVTLTANEGVTVTANSAAASFVLSNGAKLEGLTIDLPVKAMDHVILMKSGSTVKDCTVTGRYVQGDSETSRAIVGEAGATNLSITGNTFKNLRQPAYINNCTGTISNNYVDNTRGWVICGDSNMTITGNTFGENAVDIAIVVNTPNTANNYAKQTVELSKNNHGAYVQNQPAMVEAEDGCLIVGKTEGYTLGTAVAAAKDGDTIVLAAGTYDVATLNLSNKKNITLIGAGMDETILKGTDNYLLNLNTGDCSNIKVKDLTLDGNGAASTILKVGSNATCSGLTLENVKFTNATSNALYVAAASPDTKASDIVIRGCVFENIINNDEGNTSKANGIYLPGGQNVVVDNCQFKNISANYEAVAVNFAPRTPGTPSENWSITNCTFENVKGVEGISAAVAVHPMNNAAMKHVTITGNTFTGNAPVDIKIKSESGAEQWISDLVIANNGNATIDTGADESLVCKITINADGTITTSAVAKGETYTLPNLNKPGYRFNGWLSSVDNKVYTGTVTISADTTFTARWSYIDQGGGSSSSTTYQVSVDKAEGGKITVSPTRAEKGETVTITVKPDEGYELGKLTVTDKDGDKVTLTQKDDNKYTFKMPAGKVTVKATFTEIEVEPEQPELPFSDVAEQDWFYDAVVYVYENELMNGTSATTFSPSVTTSRAMMLTMLARYDGVDTSTGSTWYEAGAAWAVAEGVSDGTNLEADLTREQLVTMLWRYAGSPMVEKDLPDYPDRDEVSDWAVRAMVWAVDNGIITGNGAGELNPQGSASRAEVATILMRFIQL